MNDDDLTVAVIQHNPTIGAVSANAERVTAQYKEAANKNADVVVTPELALVGYPPRDLLHHNVVLDAQDEALDRLKDMTTDETALVVGHAAESDESQGPPLTNSATVFSDGEVAASYNKQLLPTYDIFDEHRYFCQGDTPTTVEIDDVTIGVTICEDAWYDHRVTGQQRHGYNPIEPYGDVDVLLNLSASPFHVGKPSERESRFGRHARTVAAPVVFANQVGGNDDILFDGSSFVTDAAGSVVERGAFGEEELITTTLQTDTEPATTIPDKTEQLREMLSLGISDYLDKTGFTDVVIGLSGGVDSAVTACLATDALGSEHVHGVTLPSHVTAEKNKYDAQRVAENLGIRFGEASIERLAAEYTQKLQTLTKEESLHRITKENIQARARGVILMGISNQEDALVLTPDNKSEGAVGYCTLYGDTVGAIAPLGDCTKRRVYSLAHEFNDNPPATVSGSPIPTAVIDKAPTAELAENQTDEGDIPPYDVIDSVVARYVGEQQSVKDIIANTEATREQTETIIRRLTRSEFKRQQSPPVLRVTTRAFDSGWRYPIAASYEELFD